MILKISPEIIYFSQKIQNLCKLPYYQHSRGCPNYRKKKGCPQNQPLIDKIFDFSQPLYLIYTEFPVGKFARRMKRKHPDWTERQSYNPRLWQPTARKQHRQELEKFSEKYPESVIDSSPEAHGVNVTGLMKKLGIELEWPPRNTTRVISLAGYKNE